MSIKQWISTLPLYRDLSGAVRWYTYMLNNPSPFKRSLSLAILVLIVFVAMLGLFNIIDPYPLKDWVYLRLTLADFGIWGVLVFLLMTAVLPLFSPLTIMIVTGSAAYGPLLGLLLSYIGVLLNANLAFFLIKALSVDKAWGNDKQTQHLKNAIRKNGYIIVLVLQLITIIPFMLINSAAAAAGVRWKEFMKATSLGILPCVVFYSLLGDRLVTQLVSPRIYFALISVLVLCLILIGISKKDIHLGRKSIP